MKKIKIRKNKRKKSFHPRLKYYLIIIGLLIDIILIIIILILLYKDIIFLKREKEINDYNTIYYKGKKISKKKIIYDFLSRINGSNIDKEKKNFYYYFYLPLYSDDRKFRSKIKSKLLKLLSNLKKKVLTKIETFYLSHRFPFGNNLIIINNIIFYCQIIECNKIILKEQNTGRNWLITKPIFIEKLNITIMQGHDVDCSSENIFCIVESHIDFFPPYFVKPEIRINYIKDEIIRNLPEVNVEPDDLYIHIRGSDIFSKKPQDNYGQPPLCFYEKIIDNNKFKNIYIISKDNANVVINPLIKKYKNIIFEKHDRNIDLSLLVHCYNLVVSSSTFSIGAIKLNDNLRDLWEYDNIRPTEKFLVLHHHLYKMNIKFKIHTMKPSDIYASKMFSWTFSRSQIQLMLEDKCSYDFVLTKPNK